MPTDTTADSTQHRNGDGSANANGDNIAAAGAGSAGDNSLDGNGVHVALRSYSLYYRSGPALYRSGQIRKIRQLLRSESEPAQMNTSPRLEFNESDIVHMKTVATNGATQTCTAPAGSGGAVAVSVGAWSLLRLGVITVCPVVSVVVSVKHAEDTPHTLFCFDNIFAPSFSSQSFVDLSLGFTSTDRCGFYRRVLGEPRQCSTYTLRFRALLLEGRGAFFLAVLVGLPLVIALFDRMVAASTRPNSCQLVGIGQASLARRRKIICFGSCSLGRIFFRVLVAASPNLRTKQRVAHMVRVCVVTEKRVLQPHDPRTTSSPSHAEHYPLPCIH